MFKYILFDLDGTLTDSAPGIIKSLEYAFKENGVPAPPGEVLKKFIGPPLMEAFRNVLHYDEETSKRLLEKYRERFRLKGMYENSPYDGVKELLEDVGKTGKVLAVATSKPEKYSKIITDHFDLTKYFKLIVGSDSESEDKADVIIRACKKLGVTGSDYGKVLMVGDRMYDIEGAHKCGVKCIGVKYGFAPEGELEAYKADFIVDSVPELKEFLLNN